MKTLNRLFVPLVFACLLKPASAADLAPSWTLVPETTVLIARANFSDFLAALRKQTKLGAVAFSSDRVERALQLWQSEDKDDWEELSKELGKRGLKLDDLPQLFGGEVGFALTIEPRGERAPLLVGLTWLEPGEDLARRIVKAIQDGIDEQADDPHPTRRVDLELAGYEVMHLSTPVVQGEKLDPEDFAVEPEDEAQEPSPEKLDRLREQLQEKLKNRKLVEADRTHLFVARLGGRLLLAGTVPQSSNEVLAKDEQERSRIDWDELTGVEQATGAFARFLEAHTGQGSGHAAKLLGAPGLAPALPEGTPLLEVVADPRPLILAYAVHERMANKAAGGEEKLKETLDALGLDALGPIAFRMALEGTALRSGLFVSAAAPRRGVLALLDQEPLEPSPPQWVPASVHGYTQIGFDLGAAYTKIKELAISLAGDSARQGFVQIETGVQGVLQTDPATLLSSIGRQHSIVEFPPKNDSGETRFTGRAGLVWQVKDEPLWRRVMQTIGQFAAAGGVQAAEEQGFNGYRVDQGPVPVGLFLGRGYLVLGVGEEVTESLLSMLRNPPEGPSAMRTSPLAARAAALLLPARSMIYQLSDAGSSVKTAKRTIENVIELPLTKQLGPVRISSASESSADSAESTAFAAKFKELLPSDEELEGVLGVSVGQTTLNEHGLSSQSVLELPAP